MSHVFDNGLDREKTGAESKCGKDAHLRTRLRIIIWKQWKVPKKRQWGLQKLGIGKDLARLTAYCGDRYQWVVTKTCVVRAISKERLSQAGLVSCYDDYMERHALKLY